MVAFKTIQENDVITLRIIDTDWFMTGEENIANIKEIQKVLTKEPVRFIMDVSPLKGTPTYLWGLLFAIEKEVEKYGGNFEIVINQVQKQCWETTGGMNQFAFTLQQ